MRVSTVEADLSSAAAPPPLPSHVVQRDGLTFHYADLPSFETAYKDIFKNRVYQFQTEDPHPTIIDGGAGVGVALVYFKRQYPNARVLCFEPDAQICQILRRNIATHELSGVEVSQSALGAEDGQALFLPDGADGGHIASDPPAGADSKPVTVNTSRLSRHINERVDFLKLNIEGQEYAVLAELDAAGKLPLVDQMVVEYHGRPTGPQHLGQMLNLLERNGFRYLIHDFDRETGPLSKPPFRIRHNSSWFCLVYAKRFEPSSAQQMAWGDLDRLSPVSRVFGLDRGTPIDRYYIERFLDEQRDAIRGEVLEIAADLYTRRFGAGRVTKSHVLHAVASNSRATPVGDLATGHGVRTEAFDCIILTQTLHCIYDIEAAVSNAHRALKPGGVLLATIPGISAISRYDMDRWGDYWRLTTCAADRLFAERFGAGNCEVVAHGNVKASVAFLHGLSVEEMQTADLDVHDPDYELLITVRARRDS